MGIITEIQRFSLNDGPGIRTTVFFKGCNMRCRWCHNPETLQKEPEIMFTAAKCIGCGECFAVCGNAAQSAVNGRRVIDREKCDGCFKCTDACFAEALRKVGKDVSPGDVMQQVVQDAEYYRASGGGVTLSGGEVLLQADFAAEILKKCRENGIMTAVETNMSVDYSEIEKLIPYLDLLMCDVKIFDDALHKEYTGISNRRIFDNIKRFDGEGIPMILRTPLIPGVTDTDENIGNTAEFIKGLSNAVRYELLNFNPLGAAKYDGLNIDNEFKNARPLDDGKLQRFCKTASDKGITVKAV